MIDGGALERAILSMATEDMHGLAEIVWTLNVSHVDVPKAQKIEASRAVVSRLVEIGQVTLHRLEWHPSRDLGVVPIDEVPDVLGAPSSWEPGATYVGFVATEAGRTRYSEFWSV